MKSHKQRARRIAELYSCASSPEAYLSSGHARDNSPCVQECFRRRNGPSARVSQLPPSQWIQHPQAPHTTQSQRDDCGLMKALHIELPARDGPHTCSASLASSRTWPQRWLGLFRGVSASPLAAFFPGRAVPLVLSLPFRFWPDFSDCWPSPVPSAGEGLLPG